MGETDSKNTNSSSSRVVNVNQKWILRQHPVGEFDSKRDAQLIREEINLDLTQFDKFTAATKTKTTTTSQDIESVDDTTAKHEESTTKQTETKEQQAQHQAGFLSIAPDEVVVATHAYSVDAFLRTMLDPGAFHGTI
jgi:hypothetical protein